MLQVRIISPQLSPHTQYHGRAVHVKRHSSFSQYFLIRLPCLYGEGGSGGGGGLAAGLILNLDLSVVSGSNPSLGT